MDGALAARPLPGREARRLLVVGLALALAALLAGWLVERRAGGSVAPARVAAKAAHRSAEAAPATPPPPVEPLTFVEITRDDARKVNAAIPFLPGPHPAARPFLFEGAAGDRERALTCLAAAGWYEAGNDAIGQQAVMQVVLNRMRHPAYPKSVCGVVFQGRERSTGCQFTFTCDGALARRPSPEQWATARGVAAKALGGFVFKTVGTATSYHTDWVVPYWSSSLAKIAEVHTHLFFRWKGAWGLPGAFTGRHAGFERIDPAIAYLADPIGREGGEAVLAGPAPAGGPTDPDVPVIAPRAAFVPDGVKPAALRGNVVRLMDPIAAVYGLELAPGGDTAGYVGAMLTICRGKPACTVIGWLKADRVPLALPVPLPAMRSAAFVYRRRPDAPDRLLWHCGQIAWPDPAHCMPGTEQTGAKAAGPVEPPDPPADDRSARRRPGT